MASEGERLKGRRADEGRPGRVVATAGRRVWVRDDEGDRTCFLAGARAVVGDRVRWVDARGEGGKIVEVLERDTALVRMLRPGDEQILAANLAGVFVVVTPRDPPFRGGLLDRYLVAADAQRLEARVVVNKVDLGVDDEMRAELALRRIEPLYVSAKDETGLDLLRDVLAGSERPWCLVGHSGTGKTSLAQRLLPGQEVGAIGEISEYWGAGKHTTTSSRLFAAPGGGELVDSPGIRTFAPGGLTSETVRLYFPVVSDLTCKYRDCAHRPGEDGCVAEATLDAGLLASYRRLFEELAAVDAAAAKGERLR